MSSLDIKKEALEAKERIRPFIKKTPLEHSPSFSRYGSCNVHLKLENLQQTGSFKLRGAANKILSLDKEMISKGIVTASSGNHGEAVAFICRELGLAGTIYLPEYTSQSKIDRLRHYRMNLVFQGIDCVETEGMAREHARKNRLVYIPPYNDAKIIGGQATVAIELADQLKRIVTVFVPVGGGGLISGIAGYLKSLDCHIEVIGCQPENSAVMFESIKAGKIVEMESLPTLSDGTAGGIEKDSITFDICRDLVDDFILVSEDEIKDAVRLFLENHDMLIEGAAALAVASFVKSKKRLEGKNAVLIISGGKISADQLKIIFDEGG
jgi:threonine dehydratase